MIKNRSENYFILSLLEMLSMLLSFGFPGTRDAISAIAESMLTLLDGRDDKLTYEEKYSEDFVPSNS